MIKLSSTNFQLRTLALEIALCGTALANPVSCNASSDVIAATVVELYTSEGCNSCPPADRWLSGLKGRPGVIALAFHVDYWDRLGWKDRYADPAYSRRQREISAHSGAGFVYTPQVVVNGVDYRGWPTRPRRASRPATLKLMLAQEKETYVAHIVRGPGAPVDLAAFWAVTEDGHVSQIKAGENVGMTLHHDAVVRDYLAVPTVGTSPLSFQPRRITEPSMARRVQLVVTDASSGRPLQAVSCAAQ